MTDIDKNQYGDRRIFISSNKLQYYQMFHFIQNNDGSIYVSWPDFPNTSWIFPVIDTDGNPQMGIIDFAEEGKLSIHGSGMGTFRSHNNSNNRPIIIKGNKLLDLGKGEISTRHLFTAFVKEPTSLPISPALNRRSDYLMDNTETTEPFVIIFFAIPKTEKGLAINFQMSFQIDDIDIPPRGGWGVFSLKLHDILWYVYSTHNMEKWPKKHQVLFHDGFIVPVIIGTGLGQIRLEFRTPKYLLENSSLTIEL